MKITREILHCLAYQPYRKTALVRLRPLTQEDYRERQGIIQSLEGCEKFQPGDYLARGVIDEEWVISRKYSDIGEPVAGPDEEGFVAYLPNQAIRYACQIAEPFSVERPDGLILTGKTGDYLLCIGDQGRIIDRVVFELSYTHTSKDVGMI
jgi:hypothetical protein